MDRDGDEGVSQMAPGNRSTLSAENTLVRGDLPHGPARRLCAPLQGVQVPSLVRELRSLMPRRAAKNSSNKQEHSGHARTAAAFPGSRT